MNENLETIKVKKTWSAPSLSIYGNVEQLTQGNPDPTPKGLGHGDDILAQQNPGLSTAP